jgi:hypothetical protein
MGDYLSNKLKKHKKKGEVRAFLKKHENILTFIVDMRFF